MSGKTEEQYSVLMPLWYKENLDFLQASLMSMVQQTISPAELVLIADHELPFEMERIIQDLQQKYEQIPIRLIRDDTLFGRGLGAILAFGVTQCRCPLIARMDTDDISFPERCEKELEIFSQNPDVVIVGGGIEKFSDSPKHIEGYRIPPKEGMKMRQYSKYRNPFNHPTVMFRKNIILEVGNYAPIKECEDYELWYRILKRNYKGYNLQFPVLHYRAGTNMLKRRKNKAFYQQSLQLISTMYKEQYIGRWEMAAAVGMQVIRYYAPFSINKFVYRHVRS